MDDLPRFLTPDEIDKLLSRVGPPQIMVTELRNHIHREVKDKIKYQLELVKLKPSKVEELGNRIANKSERSFYQPGNPVGFDVAESVGQPATQLVLNTFHSAGQSGPAGFERFTQNISLKQYKKNIPDFKMKIHMYRKDYSYEDLYIKAQQFVSVYVDELLDDSRIIMEEYPFEDMSMYTQDFRDLNSFEDFGYTIRLRFNREKLFLHQIPLEIIADEIRKIEGGNLFTVFCGPQLEGVIDLYPNPLTICQDLEGDLVECSKMFENGLLKTKLQGIKLGSYSNIREAHVEKIAVTKLIQDVTSHYDSNSDDAVEGKIRVWIDWVFARKEGVPVSKLEKLLELAGFPILEYDPAERYPNYIVVSSDNQNVKENINGMIRDEDSKLIESFRQTKILTSTELYNAGYYNYISTKGTNLADVRVHPEVDELYTISDYVLEIHEVLGVEVARAYLEKEIFDLFAENDQNIAPRNISIMVDWMTAGIKPISINPKRIPKSEASVIRSICFEDPKTNVVKGAILSTDEPLSNVSSKILFGSKQTLGTGAFKVEEDPEIAELYEKLQSETDRGAIRLTSESLNQSLRTGIKSLDSYNSLDINLPAPSSGLFSEPDDLEFRV